LPTIDAAPERPRGVAREPERGDPERDRDDQDAGEHARDQVRQREPPPGEDEPQDVADGAHAS
jgi:hypothetical protein